MQCSFSALASSVTCMTWCQLIWAGVHSLPRPACASYSQGPMPSDPIAKGACPQMQAPRYWWPITHLLMSPTPIINVEAFRYSQLSWTFFFFEKREKEINNFFERLSPNSKPSLFFNYLQKNTYLVEENFLCCYFFFKNSSSLIKKTKSEHNIQSIFCLLS